MAISRNVKKGAETGLGTAIGLAIGNLVVIPAVTWAGTKIYKGVKSLFNDDDSREDNDD